MRLLLDTHVVLWWRSDATAIDAGARAAIARAETVFVSAASAWEVAIKSALGKLRIPGAFADAVDHSGFDRLAIAFEHAAAVTALPLHHSDPFDRMLIAQASVEGLTLVTHDRSFAAYTTEILWT